MIRLDLEWAIAGYCISSIFLVIIFWIFYNYTKGSNLKGDNERLQQCSVCMHLFFNFQNTEIITCPLCKSLIQAQGQGQREKGDQQTC